MLHSSMAFDAIVLTPYPASWQPNLGGAAKFIKQILAGIHSKKFLILTKGESRNSESDGKNVVTTAWQGRFLLPNATVIKLFRESGVKKVLLNFEFNIFGGVIGLFGLFLILVQLKIFGAEFQIIYHPALLTMKEMYASADHLGIKRNSPLLLFYALGMRVYSYMLGILAKQIIVFEEDFKKRLTDIGISGDKIEVIPHQVYEGNINDFVVINKSVDKLTVLFFGYLVPYKGLDILLDAFSEIDPNKYQLIVVGGKSPSTMNPTYFGRITSRMSNMPNVEYHDYIPDDEVPGYFMKSDLLILPYSQMLASSGPMAWAIGQKSPFLLSTVLAPLTQTKDFRDAMLEVGIADYDLLFTPTKESIKQILSELTEAKLQKLKMLSAKLLESRNVAKIAIEYEDAIFSCK